MNSQVTDHTSVLMFLERWLAGKGTPVVEENISRWRRTVCGDLTSAFKPYNGEEYPLPEYLERDAYVERIHKASFTALPQPAATLTAADVEAFQVAAFQERGGRPSCPLPYELEANFRYAKEGVTIRLEAGNARNKDRAAGGAFNAYVYGAEMVCRSYAVSPGDAIEDVLPVKGDCHVRIDGPNGFMREVKGAGAPVFSAELRSDGAQLALTLVNTSAQTIEAVLADESYGDSFKPLSLKPGERQTLSISTTPGKQWYDISASANGTRYRFAGRVETGEWSISDPAMG